MSSSNFIRGTMLLTAASFLSKFLGMIYVIPFTNIVGETGMTLYGFAYTPYSILISVSTVGVPLAVSKFVSKYNSLDDYYTSMRIFKLGTVLMFITGIVAFFIMYFGADVIAKLFLAEEKKEISLEDAAHVIQMVSFALIIIPSMSIMRGFFQGNQSMGPTAVSQVIEQIARITFLLIGVFLIKVVWDGSNSTAVGLATFSAFVGAIASWVVLLMYWKNRKRFLSEKLDQQKKKVRIPRSKLLKELFQYAGPFVLVGIATSLYQLVDLITFDKAMVAIGKGDISTIAYSVFNVQGHKVILIPVTIATGLSLALIPEITKSFNLNQVDRLNKQINQSLQIIMFFVLPAVAGLVILSHEIYGGLFGIDNISIAGPLFAWYAPTALTFAFFTVTCSILQGIEQQKFTLISLSAGILIKILLNSLMIQLLAEKGAVITTLLATSVAVFLNLWRIKTSLKFSYRRFRKLSLLMLIFTIVMAILLLLVKWLFGFFISYNDGQLIAFVITIIAVFIGGAFYMYFGYMSTLFERIVGKRIPILDRIFRR